MRIPLVMIGIVLLTSCSSAQESVEPGSPLQHGTAPEALQAEIRLERSGEDGAEIVRIVVANPEKLPIQSIRAWVHFDPSSIMPEDLTVLDERFSLRAPGEEGIDAEQGYITLGVAARTPVRDESITLASFSIVPMHPTALVFHDWRPDGDGHTAVYSMMGGVATNILKAPLPLLLP